MNIKLISNYKLEQEFKSEELQLQVIEYYTCNRQEYWLEQIKKSDWGAGCEEGYTPREMDIVRAVAEGLSNREIANRLFITEGTVKNYITTILAKENLSHRTALAVYYLTGKK